MKRKVATRRTGEKSRKGTTSTLQELFLRKSFFLDKKLEARQGREPPCSLPERYFSQKGYFLLLTLRFMTAYVTPGQVEETLRHAFQLYDWFIKETESESAFKPQMKKPVGNLYKRSLLELLAFLKVDLAGRL